MYKMDHTKYAQIVLVTFFLFVKSCQGFLWGGDDTSTSPSTPTTTTSSSTHKSTSLPSNSTVDNAVPEPQVNDRDIDPVKAEAGTIAGAVFGIIVCIGFVIFIGVVYLRRKRERDHEYRQKTKVLKMSSHSAGVYMDTTSDMDIPNKHRNNGSGPEYKFLQKEANLYESDSDEELWSSKTPR